MIALAVYFAALTALAIPLGRLMARVYAAPLKTNVFYRLAGVDAEREMSWKRYAAAVLLFNTLGIAVVYLIQRTQDFLPWNPQQLGPVGALVALNTAVSFATNTDWQAYAGETTMSYATQTLALTVQCFLSAATGMAVLAAVLRGFSRKNSETLGNFWVDLTRSTIFVLLPLSLILAIALIAQGVPQTFDGPLTAQVLDPGQVHEQLIARGPVASQLAIKQLGTNGGGFFNVNSAHPFENPTPFSNFLEMLALLLIPAALCFTFGESAGDRRQGVAIYAAMSAIFLVLAIGAIAAEQHNLEGKELRFGTAESALWAVATTAASNGSVNAMHDSFTPLGGMIPLWLMQLGEIIYGGVGSGLYGILLYAIIAVFISGLMVGRMPEYLGKKIEAFEMKMASLAILIPAAVVLVATAIACLVPESKAAIANPGAHGFSEILYAFSSMANNNGSAFAGLTASGPFFAIAGSIAMLIGRFAVIVPALALAGSLANKKKIPPSSGTLPTHGPMFVVLLIGTILLVGALTFIPSLALGPVAEHLSLVGGKS